jgi:hypothetical protein
VQPLVHPDDCLRQFVSSPINTDWGTRDVANTESIYDGMSYHQGSVWPLFTGWAALAEYRGGQPLAGYQLLKENANLTWAQDLGADTELLSGDFFVPFGRSTAHQLWSSAMVVTPTLRGLFGISIDAQSKTITVNPHLPASWGVAYIHNIAIGDQTVDLSFLAFGNQTTVLIANPQSNSDIHLVSTIPGAKPFGSGQLALPLEPVSVDSDFRAPNPGDRSHSTRVLHEERSANKLVLEFEGPADSDASFRVLLASPNLSVHAEHATLSPVSASKRNDPGAASQILKLHFSPGTGFQTITVTLTW